MAQNRWLVFLKSWRAKHKGVSLRDSMKKASAEYKKSSKSSEPKKKSKKKVKFQDDEKDAEDKPLLGGAISPSNTKIVELKRPHLPSEVDKVLQQSVYMTATPRLQEFVHGLVSMVPTSQLAFDSYEHLYHARPEKTLHDSMHKQLSGKGARHDAPRIARAMYESLKFAPELANAYLSGRG